MPIKTSDPFRDPLLNMRAEVNRYLSILQDNASSGRLPLLYGPALADLPGRWKSTFAERMNLGPQSLILEIGSHFGEVILKMASDHPEVCLIGMDITFKRSVKLAEKSLQLGHKNLTSVLCNARALDKLFMDAELDGIFIFFPDPWAKKKRQMKNRLVNSDFVKVLRRKLRPGGFFWFKTDCLPYYEEVCAATGQQSWKLSEVREGIPAESYPSRFERLFQDEGLPCYEACWLAHEGQ